MRCSSGWLGLAMALTAIAACGGISSGGGNELPSSSGGAGGSGGADCREASAEPLGCAGEGGEAGEGSERPLEAYARLRTGCRLSVKPNPRGAPVSIDCHIK